MDYLITLLIFAVVALPPAAYWLGITVSENRQVNAAPLLVAALREWQEYGSTSRAMDLTLIALDAYYRDTPREEKE